ncbi:MAG: DNRLRE domain-containing protein [Ruminococcaceae bacterium]|nr:DNRLRE domain-containing protein [Oscillospiraceae bacterium]
MKKILAILLSFIMLVSCMPEIIFSEGEFKIVKNDSIEKYTVGEKLNVNSHPSYCGFGTGIGKTVVTDTFSRSGDKSIMQTGRCSTGATIKLHNLFGRKLTSKDIGKTFELSFYVYADKSSGVYKKKAENVSASELESYRYTQDELKESTQSQFSVYMAGPDAKSYKYRTGTVNTQKYEVKWNEWTLITYQYTVEEQYLPSDTEEDKSDPYLDSVRVGQSGDYSINKAVSDTIYIDDVMVKELGASSYYAVMTDDIESHELNEELLANSSAVFCNFGADSKETVITNTFSRSGSKSIKQSGRVSSGATVKIHNLFGRQLTEEDIGKTFLIELYVYADKNSGVYKQSVKDIPEEERDNYKYTDEELKQSTGCRFSVYMAGPDDKKYMHRAGITSDPFITKQHVPWNKWTPVKLYYTVTEEYLSNGSEENLTDPYLDSIRVGQAASANSIDRAFSDTIYIDDITVNEVGSTFKSAFVDGKMSVLNQFTQSCPVVDAKTMIFEYDPSGKLMGAMINSTPVSDDKTKKFITEYDVKANDSNVYVTVWSNLHPLTPLSELSRSYNADDFVPPTVAKLRAEEMLSLSQADYKDALTKEDKLQKDNLYFFSSDDTYVKSDEADENFGTEGVMKVSESSSSMVKFDISSAECNSVSHAYVSLYTDAVVTGDDVDIYAVSSDWDEGNLTYNKIPSKGDRLDTVNAGYHRIVYFFDVTSYVNNCLKNNVKNIAFSFEADEGDITFISKESTRKSFKPELILEGINMAEKAKKVSSFDRANYVDVWKKQERGTKGSFTLTPTRIISSVKDYIPVEKAPQLNKYGSPITEERYEATGFFRTELIDGRWWIIDPEGYRQIHMAVSVVRPEKNNEKETNAFNAKYGTDENWAKMVVDELRPYGFNGAGPWSSYKLMLNADGVTPLNQAGYNSSFILAHGNKEERNKGILGVFDPSFESTADRIAKAWIAPYADDPHILGWITDNEPPASDNMLIKYLTCDPYKNGNVYNYHTAWAWLKDRHGEDVSVDDITDKDKMDWVEFVYDRYMKVCTDAIRKYDKNHMILGPKLDKPHQGSFRGIKKWVDIVCYDYYGNAWTCDMPQVEQWYLWAGKPIINAEWYCKAEDAVNELTGLTNFSGVGWQAKTQKERGYYYQSFVLDMLESKAFVGWQWFRYIDNPGDDKYDEGADTNANKGVYTNYYEPWEELLSQMKYTNENTYSLIDYFDNK